MKKISLFIAVTLFLYSYPDCGMCHNSRIAPKLDSMSEKEITRKLINMKKSKKINPKMAFIKNLSDDEIRKISKKIKEKK
jgi:cytochrome c553